MRSSAGHVTFFASCKVIQFQESGEFLIVACRICETDSPVDCGILGFEIRNSAKGIKNPVNDWNPESKFHWQEICNPAIHSLGSRIQDCLGFPYVGWPSAKKRRLRAYQLGTIRPGQNSGVIIRDDHQSRKKPQHLYERITFSEISFHFSTIQWIGWPKVVTLGAFPGSQFFETQKLWKKKRKKRRSFCNYPQVRISSHLDFLYSLSISFKCFSFRVVFRWVNI